MNRGAGGAAPAGALLRNAVRHAVRAATQTEGVVDPTVGRPMRLVGYDRTFVRVQLRDGRLVRPSFEPAGRWREIEVDDSRGTVRVPAGVELDLGATAKAFAADRTALEAALETGAGVLVSIGGDVAVAGPPPTGGWSVGIAHDHSTTGAAIASCVTLTSGGLASSGSRVRHWATAAGRMHHILTPDGPPGGGRWATVSVAAGSCVDANTASTAAIVLGEDAPAWLERRRLPARLAGEDGEVVLVCGWPVDRATVSAHLVAASSPSAFWYLTRGSGVVALLLLTTSICLGIATTLRWRASRLPRFAVAGLHRNVTLLAVVFLVLHVVTTLLDGYAPIGWKDALVPFLSPYRPLWLGLGAIAFDLLLALVITSLVRAQIGYQVWRATHWLAYASWPVALAHSLGTGSDARSAGSRRSHSRRCCRSLSRWRFGSPRARAHPAAASAAIAVATTVLLGIGAWYRGGPGARGWAARAGTPAALLARSSLQPRPANARPTTVSLPSTFRSQFAGRLTASRAGDERIDIRIDGRLRSGIEGRLRLVLEGFPLDGGGVSMSASGVAFAVAGSPVYEGKIVGLDGNRISARVSSGSETIDLQIGLQLQPGRSRVTGIVEGALA